MYFIKRESFVYCFRHQLETPGKYSQLMAFYEDKKGTLPFAGSSHSISNLSTPGTEILPELKVSLILIIMTKCRRF